MKNFRMTNSKGSAGEKPMDQSRATDTAFDNWLNRGLHQIFDDVMNEPIPAELLKILQTDQKK
ncbi:MAG: hypothetical protein EOO77_31815 [Oxalobacteraceae bacterium]|nr:MAG: hypothetical protein EOO77_31815 [Oxalobacteraceae bacterium]